MKNPLKRFTLPVQLSMLAACIGMLWYIYSYCTTSADRDAKVQAVAEQKAIQDAQESKAVVQHEEKINLLIDMAAENKQDHSRVFQSLEDIKETQNIMLKMMLTNRAGHGHDSKVAGN